MSDGHTVSQAATMIGVSPSTIRSWASTFADHLSPGASPTAGNERLFTVADVAILQTVKAHRDTGASYDQINSRLQAIDPTDLQPYIDIVPVTPAPTPTDSPQALQMALQFIQAIDDRTSPLQRQIERIESNQSSRFTFFVFGFICGALVVLVAILALSLGVSR